jgi:CRP/FNR family transcriptional regulator
LKEFERRGWLTLNRGVIELRDPSAIGRLAAVP